MDTNVYVLSSSKTYYSEENVVAERFGTGKTSSLVDKSATTYTLDAEGYILDLSAPDAGISTSPAECFNGTAFVNARTFVPMT